MKDKTKERIEKLGLSIEDFEPSKTEKEEIAELKDQNEMLIQCILEMAEIIYA